MRSLRTKLVMIMVILILALMCVIGAFLIGICETIIKGLPSAWNVSVFSDAFTFALLIIILTCKPTGLFGEKATDKV